MHNKTIVWILFTTFFGIIISAVILNFIGILTLDNKFKVAEIVSIFTGFAAILLIFVTAERVRLYREAEVADNKIERAGLVKDVLNDMFSNKHERIFVYNINYRKWEFDPDKVQGTVQEVYLDRILYRLSYVGYLLEQNLVTISDVSILRYITKDMINSQAVQDYIKWSYHSLDEPEDISFQRALYLYWRLFGNTREFITLASEAPKLVYWDYNRTS